MDLAGARVCMLLYNPYTHDSRVRRESRTLLDAGADVRIVARTGAGLPAREVADGVRVARLPFDPLPSRLARAIVARRRGATVPASPDELPLLPRDAPVGQAGRLLHELELGGRRGLVALTYAHWYRRAIREALREPVDLVVAHDFETLPPAWVVARRRGARLLYDAHELAADQHQIVERTRLGTARLHRMERALARRAAAVVTVNDALADELVRRHGIPRPAVVRNAPDEPAPVVPDRSWLAAAGVPAAAPVAIYTGGLVEHRGLEDLVAAMPLMPDVWVVLLGPGRPGFVDGLRERAERLGAADRLRILPPVPSPEVPARCAAADVGVIPFRRSSLNHWLSLPNKLFEYLAAGLPIVTVPFPELRRIVEGYAAGRVFAEADPAALAAAVRAVLQDPAEHERLTGGARRAARELTWANEAPAYLAAVRRALS